MTEFAKPVPTQSEVLLGAIVRDVESALSGDGAIEDLTIYEKAMTTGRPAHKLARKHGFKSVGQVADFLPEEASVIDVGAGASSFGKAVALLRPDITWVNYDYSYKEPYILDEVSKNAPANVHFVQGNAVNLVQEFAPETFDAAFSYWLFPHLSLDDIDPAKLAARAIFNVTKPGGLISIGPEMSKSRLPVLPSIQSQKSIRVTKDGTQDAESFADMMADKTSVRGYTRFVEKLSNEVMTTNLGTSRYFMPGDRFRPLVYDPEKGEYVKVLSLRGIRIAGGLILASARYVQKTITSS
jgi:ubiquinone/menaquinone biosynthesis C-methylase UbiE